MPWPLVLPLVVGAAGFAVVGGWLNQWLPVRLITAALGGAMVIGSALVLRRGVGGGAAASRKWAKYDFAVLVLIGCMSGLAAGLTGAGGPLISIPLMAALAYPVLASIGASQVMQVVASVFGVALYWQTGHISFSALAVVVPLQLAGIVLGVRISHAIDVSIATRGVALLGICAGVAILGVAIVSPLP